ncbi:MAG: Fibronectin, type [Candidatus Angelobacter sp.]|nr:Fibronectin, type [Candidatus Angelobacter sp.]
MRTCFRAHKTAALLLLVAAILLGCGTPGAPQPPSLHLPKPVDDLQAVRKGDVVYLRWTVPTETTDGQGVKVFGASRICRGYATDQPGSCKDVVADLPTAASTKGYQEFTDKIAQYIGGNRDFLTYTVRVNNARNKNAGLSNAVTVFLAPSLPPPSVVAAKLLPDAVQLSWEMPEPPQSPTLKTNYLYRIVRSSDQPAKGQPARVAIAEVPAKRGSELVLDKNFTWEKTYQYRVVGVTQVISREGKKLAEFEGEDSPAATIVAHDVFPPARPSGLQAVYSALDTRKFIDLTWTPNEESDLAGYNVYRKDGENIAPVRINTELVKTPSFRDENVAAGNNYIYSVTAVDARGNESPMSEPAQEKVPQ